MSITCRVFGASDTLVGGVPVLLHCIDYPALVFEATTNEEGSVLKWHSLSQGSASDAELVISLGNTSWSMTFDVLRHVGSSSSFPRIKSQFCVHTRAHHRITLLINEESYGVVIDVTAMSTDTPPQSGGYHVAQPVPPPPSLPPYIESLPHIEEDFQLPAPFDQSIRNESHGHEISLAQIAEDTLAVNEEVQEIPQLIGSNAGPRRSERLKKMH
ncbi:hypothetical protein F5B22DRAFT_584684 [Xylaria bambusicola]|uniref:uncharacterized protein n=1 Tax=Xylaria bambusicola TaxID=326684 RepID=UPI00200729EF|nr:uncharacterized protein F5B22DRAFT_584684 [Xylaria bambusicola]KAI0526170.1 hypothetical protein F5B22DRAFT_584684 [Xylaria bambusicola]